MRKEIKPEQVFYDDIKKLIINMFTEANPKIKSSYYWDNNHNFRYGEFLVDQKERVKYILERMEQEKHLINL